jgi:hypothetical protein
LASAEPHAQQLTGEDVEPRHSKDVSSRDRGTESGGEGERERARERDGNVKKRKGKEEVKKLGGTRRSEEEQGGMRRNEEVERGEESKVKTHRTSAARAPHPRALSHGSR